MLEVWTENRSAAIQWRRPIRPGAVAPTTLTKNSGRSPFLIRVVSDTTVLAGEAMNPLRGVHVCPVIDPLRLSINRSGLFKRAATRRVVAQVALRSR